MTRRAIHMVIFFSIVHFVNGQEFSISLKDEDLKKSVELNGEWGFAFNELIDPDQINSENLESIQVPSSWWSNSDRPHTGTATYFVKVILPQNVTNKTLGLYIPHIFSSYKLFINGKEAYSSGQPGTEDTYIPRRKPHVVRLTNRESEELDLVFHVANFSHNDAGIYYPLVLGDYLELDQDLFVKQGINLVLSGGLLITGIVLLAFSLVYKQLNLQVLFFSLFALSLMYRMLGSFPYPLNALILDYPFHLAIHLEYASIHTAALFGGAFIFFLYPKYSPRSLTAPFYIVSLISLLLVIILPPTIFTTILKYYLFFILAYAVVFIYIIVKAKLEKEDTSGYLIAALVVVLIWTLFQVITFLNIRVIPYSINVVLITAIIVTCNLALFRTFVLKIRRSESLQAELDFNKSRQTMLALISHEIKTPVATLQMTMEMLKASKENPLYLTRLGDKPINNAVESISTIKEMVNDFLLYMGQQSRSIESITLLTIIERIEARFKVSIPRNQLSKRKFQTDLVTLEYILSTLWSNAEKFTSEFAPSPEIIIYEKNNHAVIEVKDHGVGMDNQQVEEFGQASVSLSDGKEVSGIGLYLAFELAREIDHELKVKSELNKGTTIYIYLKPA